MSIQVGTVDGLVNISSVIKDCFVEAIHRFREDVFCRNLLVGSGLSLGDAFQRFTYPVYSGMTGTYNVASLKTEVLTKNGKKQSPAYVTYCKKMGLLKTDGDRCFELTELAESLKNSKLSLAEYALIYMSKQGIFVDKDYKDNLLVIIAEYFSKHASITQDLLADYIAKKFGSTDFEKTRFDIILSGLCVAKLITKIDKVYVLSGICQASILKNISEKQILFTPSLLDTDANYSEYIGTLKNGLFDIFDETDKELFRVEYPNIAAFLSFGIKPYKKQDKYLPTILYGPPGTGKTYTLQKEYLSKFNECFVTTFHQSFSYEEFVEGLKPLLDNSTKEVKYDIEKGIFYRACIKAAELAGYSSFEKCLKDIPSNRNIRFNKAIADNKTVLLCIDEINRGNVASIFGDLISLIEPSKRLGAGELEMTAILPYSKEPFGVPANLFIVGTMNTADRSIQLLDSALRRRFKFEELLPNYEVIENEDAKNVLKNINARVRCLLNKDNQIGHSYLMHAKNSYDILSALYNKIIPLLEEYFYNDITKVRFVLNDLKNGQFYVEDAETKEAYQSYLNDGDADGEEREFFKLNPAIADAIESNDETECDKFLVNLLSKGV